MNTSGLNLVRTRSLADQVADSIVDGIATGKLNPGQRIVEADLSSQLEVSRIPVREAIKTLVAQGILEVSHHRGARVIAVDGIWVGRTREIRAALEKLAARDARRAYAADPETLAPLDAVIERMARAAREGDRLAVDRADIDFHRELCRASGNDVVTIQWNALARHAFIILAREKLADGDLHEVVDVHRKLRTAIALSDEPLDKIVDRHILDRDHMALRG
ncbi:MAG TPA: GntR family transcriptional regulator [Alphaproteobacteria bacterium]|nr:GntR family transcriptional regulator [Alphaproteobacteria bacterium]